MKLSRCFLTLAVSSIASASFFGNRDTQVVLGDKAFSVPGNTQVVLGDKDLSVPGDNPLKYCESPDGDILEIDFVDLHPNPPLPGETLTIEAKGNFTKPIEEGAFVYLTVKWGIVRLIYQKLDLCEQMQQVDKECPLEGYTTITKNVTLPEKIPPGKYHVIADVYTARDAKVACLTATVEFHSKRKI